MAETYDVAIKLIGNQKPFYQVGYSGPLLDQPPIGVVGSTQFCINTFVTGAISFVISDNLAGMSSPPGPGVVIKNGKERVSLVRGSWTKWASKSDLDCTIY